MTVRHRSRRAAAVQGLRLGALALSVSAALASSQVHAAGAKPDAKSATAAGAKAEPQKPQGLSEPPKGTLAEQYCLAIRDAAAEARQAHQIAELKALGKEIDDRLAKLDARSAELRDWVQQRDAFANRATAQLVAIYAAMRPESASEQLARINELTAAAVLGKLEPRAASAILNDMPPEKAGRLATILAGASRARDRGDGS